MNAAHIDLLSAAKNGDVSGVKQALSANADINAIDENGWTAAMWAASKQHVSVIQILNKAGADFAVRDPINYDAWDLSARAYLENEPNSAEIRSLIRESAHYVAKQEEYAVCARTFADKLKNVVGGRIKRHKVAYTHADWLLKTLYEGMQCEFNIFAGGFDLWIENFDCKTLHAYFNLEGQDNLNAAEPAKHPVRIREVFSADYQAYALRDAAPYEQTKQFADDSDIKANIVGLCLGRYEWLVISGGQIRLRNQSEDVEVVRSRLDHLRCIFGPPAEP